MNGRSVLKRTQVYLEEDILDRLRAKARRERLSMAALVRRALIEFMANEKTSAWENDPLWDIAGLGASHAGDLARNHDKYIYRSRR